LTKSVVALVLALGGAGPASPVPVLSVSVHARLERSVPAAGDTLASPPARLRLEFSGSVEETGAEVRLLGPGGRTWSLESTRDSSDPRVLLARLPELALGGFRVEWRVISADGHPVVGDFVFFLRSEDVAQPISPPPPPSPGRGGVDGETGRHLGFAGGPGRVGVPIVVIGAAKDLALLLLAGMLLFVAWWLPAHTRATERAVRSMAAAGPTLAVAYAWLWVGNALGNGAGLEARVEGLLSLASGRALAAETGFAWLSAWALFVAWRPRVASVFALLAVAAGAVGGHPASHMPSVAGPSNALHLLAVAAWTGGLFCLVTEQGSQRFGETAHRVSDVALVAAITVAATGVLQSWLFLGSLDRLIGSTYGILICAKGLGLAGLVLFGAYHRYRLVPDHDSTGGAATLARSVRNELMLAGAVVVTAAILSHVPPTS
jgi:putative copper export protein/methionine-rich copper-binding protein CopC